MTLQSPNTENPQSHFIFVASELIKQFPDLDLRFNFQNGTHCMRLMIASISRDIIELSMESENPEAALHDAMFAVKERARLFDD